MSIIDLTARAGIDAAGDVAPHTGTSAPTVPEARPTACHLVWDLPNMTSSLGRVIGSSAAKKTRYDFATLANYVVEVAGEDLTAAGTVFVNVDKDQLPGLQRFVNMLRSCGFGVYARPKIDDSDIDDNLVAHVQANAADIAHLLIATHDKGLADRTAAVLDPDCRVTVLGFEELSSYALGSDRFEFVDLGDIDGMFTKPLARSLLSRLPDEGTYLRPLGSLKGTKRAA